MLWVMCASPAACAGQPQAPAAVQQQGLQQQQQQQPQSKGKAQQPPAPASKGGPASGCDPLTG